MPDRAHDDDQSVIDALRNLHPSRIETVLRMIELANLIPSSEALAILDSILDDLADSNAGCHLTDAGLHWATEAFVDLFHTRALGEPAVPPSWVKVWQSIRPADETGGTE